MPLASVRPPEDGDDDDILEIQITPSSQILYPRRYTNGPDGFAESAEVYPPTMKRPRPQQIAQNTPHTELKTFSSATLLRAGPNAVAQAVKHPVMDYGQGNRKTGQEKWHNLRETEKQNAARVAFSATLNQHFIDQELYLIFFLASLSTSLIFFFLTLPTTGQNRIILKCSNIEANQSSTQPHGVETVWRMDIITAMQQENILRL